jgi:hypothetical protein
VDKNADEMLDVDLQSNCSINFLPTNTSSVEAFSIDLEVWNSFYTKCNERWKISSTENYIADLIMAGNNSQAVAKINVGTERSAEQKLKLVVLFAYELDQLSNLGHFCFALDELEMQNQCFSDVHKRISKFHHTMQVEVLGFWFYVVKADQNNSTINSSDSMQSILSLINTEKEYGGTYGLYWKKFLALSKDIKMFFLPMLTSDYYDKGLRLSKLLGKLRVIQDPLVCFAYHELFLKLQIDGKMDTIEALQLREDSSHKLLENENLTIANEAENRMCENVKQGLLKHAAAHAQIFLALYDADHNRKHQKLQNHKLTHLFIAEIIHSRYSKRNLTRLVNLLWEGYGTPGKFSCAGSLYLVKEMQHHPAHLASLPALQLFFKLEFWFEKPHVFNGCSEAKKFAPDFVKRFIFGDTACKCCSAKSWHEDDSGCMNSTIRDLEVALAEMNFKTSSHKFELEILFWNYIVINIQNMTKSSFIYQISDEDNLKVDKLQERIAQLMRSMIADFELKQNRSISSDTKVQYLLGWFKNSKLISWYYNFVIANARKQIFTHPTTGIRLKINMLTNKASAVPNVISVWGNNSSVDDGVWTGRLFPFT